jgi:hypothetical protein
MEPFQALVLQTSAYRETSVMLKMLTAQHGVVRAMAKGARRPKGISPAALEAFAWIEGTISLRAPDALGTLGVVTLHEGWPYLRSDPTRWAFAALGLEVLGRLGAASAPDEALFNEGCLYLGLLEKAPGAGSLTALLLLRLLHYAGFPPPLPPPGSSDPPPEYYLHDFESASLLPAGSGMVPAGAIRLPASVIAALGPALASPPPLATTWTLPAEAGRAALHWFIRLWEDHLGRPLASARYLDSMVLGG